MKKLFEQPELSVEEFEIVDVILSGSTAPGTGGGNDTEIDWT